MDCIFNKCIPESSNNKIIIRPTSKTFINGLAQSYDTTFPNELSNIISEKEYSYAINKVIEDASMWWPCCFCLTYGYMFSICTLGLSFWFPMNCISEAKVQILQSIIWVNENILNKYNLNLSYKQKCSTSWLEIDINFKENFNPIIERKENERQDLLIKNQLN